MIWNKTLAVGAALVMMHSAAWAERTEACANVDEQEIAALFDRWNESLQTGDPDQVVANYAHDALLLPTVSNKPRDTPDEIREYFVHFLQKKPVGHINERHIKLGCNYAIDAGVYTFTVTGPEGEEVQVPARYTYAYTYSDGNWLIWQHHSSMMPERAVASTH